MRTPYDDIINLPHHQSATRPHMSNSARAAQFAPFAALVGYDDAVAEAGRLTEARILLDEDQLAELNCDLQIIMGQLQMGHQPTAAITYFEPDKQKEGGQYITRTSPIKKIDCLKRLLVLSDDAEISLDYIYKIDTQPTIAP